MKKINVTASGKYDVLIGNGLLKDCGKYISEISSAKKLAVISDDTVDALYGDSVAQSLSANGFEVCRFTFPHGEQSKTVDMLAKIWNFLCENNITRIDCLVALGGGVVGDITGFAAATFLRGIDFVQLPTTLLAQVDSSVGGKTAVDLPGGKNLVGMFKQPKLVLCDIDTLNTLSDEFFTDGMGEVVKYGMIKSLPLFEELEVYTKDTLKNNTEALESIISQSITIKRNVVEEDEFDRGERMLLNFGHTLGHSLEQYYNYTGITHGQAVAAGMKMITAAAEKNGFSESGTLKRLTGCLDRYGLNISVEPSANSLGKACLKDKKRFGDSINIVICRTVGTSELKKMPVEEFLKIISEI